MCKEEGANVTTEQTQETTDVAQRLRPMIAARAERMIETRRYFHQHPEISFQETETGRAIAERLRAIAPDEMREGVGGGAGVLAVVRGGRPGGTVLIRADIDGLPMDEQNDVPYRSQNANAMHACGHDGHITIALTLAEIFAEMRGDLPGTYVFAFQPAEERGGGADDMIRAGALDNPRVDSVIGLHLWNNMEVGTVGVRDGAIFASADMFEIVVTGKGGHGSMPQQTVDATVVGAAIVTALQTLVSREVSAFDNVVVSIGSFQSGYAPNIISGEARLTGTLRTFDPAMQERMQRRIVEVAEGTAATMRATATTTYDVTCPAVINDAGVTDAIRAAVRATDGLTLVEAQPVPIADDMSVFLLNRPGSYFLMGSANSARGLNAPHHHPRFDFDEAALPPAVEVLGRAALRLASGG